MQRPNLCPTCRASGEALNLLHGRKRIFGRKFAHRLEFFTGKACKLWDISPALGAIEASLGKAGAGLPQLFWCVRSRDVLIHGA